MAFTTLPARPKIAVIGAGISGLGAAFSLQDTADVTLFEKRERLGGHACTVEVEHQGVDIAVDIGFIVCNDLNYRNFVPLMDHLGVELVDSDMSFSVSGADSFEWSSDPRGIFAWKRNALRPRFISMLRDILKFNTTARQAVASGRLPEGSLRDYIQQVGVSQTFVENYLLPMGAAIWSTPEKDMLDYPAASFVSFFDNHRLMHSDRPTWRTVKGGSKTYVKALTDRLDCQIHTGAQIEVVRPGQGGQVEIVMQDGALQLFDDVMLACHSDQAQKLLSPQFVHQRRALAQCRYAPNSVYLHCDEQFMPKRKSAWASWNVRRGHEDRVCVTYWMNRLQAIRSDRPLFVTLNPDTTPAEEKTFLHTQFDHPLFDSAALTARNEITALQGHDGIWFAGAWLGDGFHEAGLKSGLSVGFALGGETPWTAFGVNALARPNRQTEPLQINSSGSAS